jgi:glycosyltransferase involved in cell wall biosynthesis
MHTRCGSVLWVYNGSLANALDRATWLETAAVLADLGWHVTIAAVELPSETDERIKVLRLPRPGGFVLGYLLFHATLLFRLMREIRNYDVIVFEQYSAPFLLPLVPIRNLLRRQSPRFVLDVRTTVMSAGFTARSRAWMILFEIAHRLANGLADGQTAITSRMAEAVGIPEHKLLGVWSSGVKTERFAPAIDSRRWPSPQDPLRLIYIGVIYEERNLLGLCQAVQRVRAEGLDVRLKIVGEGPQRAELGRFAQEAGGGIEVCAPVPPAEVPDLLAEAHVGVLPFPDRPYFRVSSPIKLFECMAAGMPILATHIVCHTDVLDGDYVFWADDESVPALAAAIRQAWRSKTEFGAMGQRAAQSVQSWTWRRSAERFSAALLKAIDVPDQARQVPN